MRLVDLAIVKTNFTGADFWMIRKGSSEKVGMPVEFFKDSFIGIKITKTEVITPAWAFYSLVHLHNKGLFKVLAKGTTNLVHITLEDVKHIPVG